MAVPVILPKMEMMMEAGKIARWLVREGERVEQGQPIVEVITDKVNMELEAPASGVLAGIRAHEGDEVPVARTIAYVVQPGEPVPPKEAATSEQVTMPAQRAPISPPVPPAPPADHSPAPQSPGPRAAARPQVSAAPAVRRLAAELGVDLTQVIGTGPNGRVTEADVRAAVRPERPREP